MMEFTYDGMVRCGFGFYNPNHAAALICAVLPFLWGWKKWQAAGWICSLLLTVPLVLTYSRSGILVAAFELAVFFVMGEKRKRKFMIPALLILFAAVWCGGVLGRFAFDKAVSNRPEIWLAGLKLAAVNPLGTGLGNSGLLASVFLLEDIECRTLVNSHLTLRAEFGMVCAFLWGWWIIGALIRGFRCRRIWCAFAGLVLSAGVSGVFDWGVLSDFREYGSLTLCNFILSWLMLLFFAAMGIYLVMRRDFPVRTLWYGGGAALLLTLGVFIFYDGSSPRVRDGMFERDGMEMPLVLYCEPWNMKTVIPLLDGGGCRVPLNPGNFRRSAGSVWLFGNAAEYAGDYRDAGLTFVSPPEFFVFPENTEKIYARRYIEEYCTDKETVWY